MNNLREKILVICPRRPYPLKSGMEIYIFQYIKFFSEYYMVDVAYVSEQKEEEDELNTICNSIISVKANKRIRNLRAIAYYLFQGMPLQVGQTYYRKLQKYVNEHSNEYKFIFCVHIKTISYAMKLSKHSNALIYYAGMDSITLQSLNAYKVSRGWRKFAYWVEYRRMLTYEKEVYERIKYTTIISQRDKDYIINKLKAKCNPSVIYNYALDLGYCHEIEKDECSACFMGKMDYSPNVEAVTYFVQNIFESIKREYPSFKFYIIGGYVSKRVKKLERVDGVIILGYVDNPAYYLQKSTLVIAPMRNGAGLQNKIIQSMYLECMVLTSEIGAAGLTDLKGNELVVYHSDSDFIGKLRYYLSEQAKRERQNIGKNAREYVMKTYSYDAVKRQMIDTFLNNGFKK